jgi:hypothetical protein
VEETLADLARIREGEEDVNIIKAFYDGLNKIGNIPISLGRWELTGEKYDILQ